MHKLYLCEIAVCFGLLPCQCQFVLILFFLSLLCKKKTKKNNKNHSNTYLLLNHMFTRQLSSICQLCISQKPMTLLYTALLLHHSLCISRTEYELNYCASAPIYSGFKTLHQFPLQYIMM
jgi:hypothetical protein